MEIGTVDYKSRDFIVLWMINFMGTFAVSLISTPTPYLIKGFIGGDQTAIMAAYGVIISLGYAATTVGSLLGGFLADIIGTKTVVLASFTVLTVGCGLFYLAPNLNWLYLSSSIEMFAVGFSGPAVAALVADFSAQSSRGMAYGVFGLSGIVSRVPAPILGGVIAQFVDLRIPFAIGASLSFIGMLLVILMKGKNVEKKQKINERSVLTEELDSKQPMPVGTVMILFGMTRLLNGLLNGFLSPLLNGFLILRLNTQPTEFGLVSSIASGVVTALVQIPGGKLTDKFGRKPLVLFGFLAAPVVFLLAYSQTVLDFMLLLAAISAIGNTSSPASAAWLMDLVPKHRRASVSGVTQTLNGIGLSVGPFIGSFVWNSTIPVVDIPFGLAAIIFAMGVPFYLVIKEPRKDSLNTKKTV